MNREGWNRGWICWLLLSGKAWANFLRNASSKHSQNSCINAGIILSVLVGFFVTYKWMTTGKWQDPLCFHLNLCYDIPNLRHIYRLNSLCFFKAMVYRRMPDQVFIWLHLWISLMVSTKKCNRCPMLNAVLMIYYTSEAYDLLS